MKRILSFALLAATAFGAGSVRQSDPSPLGQSGLYALAAYWTGDSSNGTVPATVLRLSGCCQGFYVTQVEVAPGTPSPTNGYSVTLTDSIGVDVLAGSASSLSSSTGQSFAAAASAAPIFGALTLNVTGNSVNSAQGAVIVYLSKPTVLNAAAFRQSNPASAFNQGSVAFITPNGFFSQDNNNFFYNTTNHTLMLRNKNCLLAIAECIGSGFPLQGSGMLSTGLDTPNVGAATAGTVASPDSSTDPAWTWARISSANYTAGLPNFEFYGDKIGPAPGGAGNGAAMENLKADCRQEQYPSDIVCLQSQNFMTQGTGYSTNQFGTGWGMDLLVTKTDAFDKLSGIEIDVDNFSGVDPSTRNYSANGLVNGFAVTHGGSAHASEAIEISTPVVAISTLSGSLGAGATTFTLSTPSFGSFSAPASLEIGGSEIVQCTTLVSLTYSGCTRGALGTTAAMWSGGTSVVINPSFLEGIDFESGSIAPNGFAMRMPNNAYIASRDPTNTVTTPLLYQDGFNNTVINAKSSGATYFMSNQVAKAHMDANGNFFVNSVAPTATAFMNLPTCTGSNEGQTFTVNDSTTNTWGATITGGSSMVVGAFCDGTNWTVYAK